MMQLDHSPVTTPPPVTITVVPKEAPPKPDPKKDPPPKPRPKDRKVASERKPKQPPAPTAKPVQGLSAEAISAEGTGIAAPIGNTLMTEDEGKRLKAEDVGALGNQDLSADARLIRSSFQTPSYTEAAIDAAIEGTYVVDVYVDETGNVTSAELTKKVGYGMDERLLAAANQARFEPRKNRFGKAEPGWTTISFRLELP
jgi:protein TonB